MKTNGSNKVALRDLNFGDVDAKNEILKQSRAGERFFFDSFLIPEAINIEDYKNGMKFFILGLKGTGKTALLRFIHDRAVERGDLSEMLLFKSDITEEDRKNLSVGSGFQIISMKGAQTFVQDFKEPWKWFIYQKIAENLKKLPTNSEAERKFIKLTGVGNSDWGAKLGQLFSRLSSAGMKLSGESLGVAVEVGVEMESGSGEAVSISALNRACSLLLNDMDWQHAIYVLFDELELFNQTEDQFDRDRRIIRDLIFAISAINAESAENARRLFLLSSLRSEVLHSILELGQEIGRDVDDYGDRLDWTGATVSRDHPSLRLIERKIEASSPKAIKDVWGELFPLKINNQDYFQFILNSSYFRPRDIVRLLRVARDYDKNAFSFTTAHFDQTSIEYSRQTWLEISDELLATYSSREVHALQRLFLGFRTHFFFTDVVERVRGRDRNDEAIQELFRRRDAHSILADLYRIGVIGNDFVSIDKLGHRKKRNRWIFRGNTILNDAERMAFHKSLWKHLSLV
jgi:hypothetical protein